MVRVLFLDVDGVVCCNHDCLLEVDKMQRLQKICETTDCKVVVSSNWRLYDNLRQHLYQQLASYNIECVGTTPDAGEGQHGMPMRPWEIKAWVDEWNGQPADTKNKRPAITSFVALDDRHLTEESYGEFLRDHFVQTTPSIGLSERATARAIDLLLNPPASEPRSLSPDSVLSLPTTLDAVPSSPPKTAKATGERGGSTHSDAIPLGGPTPHRPPRPQHRAQPFRAPHSAALRSDVTLTRQRVPRGPSSSPASTAANVAAAAFAASAAAAAAAASLRLTRPPKSAVRTSSTAAFASPLNQSTGVKFHSSLPRSPAVARSSPNPQRLPPLMG